MDTTGFVQQSPKRLAAACDAIEKSIALQVKALETVEKALRVLTKGQAAIAASRSNPPGEL